MTFHLQQREAIATGLRRIAHEQIGIVLSDLSSDVLPAEQQVHSLRARCKKLRSILRLAQPRLGVAFEAEDQRFREAARQVAESRDRDVFIKTVAVLGGTLPPGTVDGHDTSTDAINRAREIMAGAQDAVDRWPLGDIDFDDIASGFAQTYRAWLEAWQQVQRGPDDENFHTWRKRTKNYWYQVRILERLNKPVLRERRQLLWQLQRALGEAHDLAVLEQVVRSWKKPDDLLLRHASARKTEFYATATALGPRIFSTTEPDPHADMTRWWSAWRS